MNDTPLSCGYKPTPRIRFIERKVPVAENANACTYKRILQQRWESDFVGEEPVWQDVALEPETESAEAVAA